MTSGHWARSLSDFIGDVISNPMGMLAALMFGVSAVLIVSVEGGNNADKGQVALAGMTLLGSFAVLYVAFFFAYRKRNAHRRNLEAMIPPPMTVSMELQKGSEYRFELQADETREKLVDAVERRGFARRKRASSGGSRRRISRRRTKRRTRTS